MAKVQSGNGIPRAISKIGAGAGELRYLLADKWQATDNTQKDVCAGVDGGSFVSKQINAIGTGECRRRRKTDGIIGYEISQMVKQIADEYVREWDRGN